MSFLVTCCIRFPASPPCALFESRVFSSRRRTHCFYSCRHTSFLEPSRSLIFPFRDFSPSCTISLRLFHDRSSSWCRLSYSLYRVGFFFFCWVFFLFLVKFHRPPAFRPPLPAPVILFFPSLLISSSSPFPTKCLAWYDEPIWAHFLADAALIRPTSLPYVPPKDFFSVLYRSEWTAGRSPAV